MSDILKNELREINYIKDVNNWLHFKYFLVALELEYRLDCNLSPLLKSNKSDNWWSAFFEKHLNERLKVQSYKEVISILNKLNSLLLTGKEISGSYIPAYQLDPKIRKTELLIDNTRNCIIRISNLLRGKSLQNISEQFHRSKLNLVLDKMTSKSIPNPSEFANELAIFDDVNNTLDVLAFTIADNVHSKDDLARRNECVMSPLEDVKGAILNMSHLQLEAVIGIIGNPVQAIIDTEMAKQMECKGIKDEKERSKRLSQLQKQIEIRRTITR